MGVRVVASVPCEGGVWESPGNPDHPIKLYSDRRIKDQCYLDGMRMMGMKPRSRFRQTLNRKDYRFIRKFIKRSKV